MTVVILWCIYNIKYLIKCSADNQSSQEEEQRQNSKREERDIVHSLFPSDIKNVMNDQGKE